MKNNTENKKATAKKENAPKISKEERAKRAAAKCKKIAKCDEILHTFKGGSIRALFEEVRAKGAKMPHLYKFIDTTPLRNAKGKRVIIAGRYALGCVTSDGVKMRFAEWSARYGYKIPTTGNAAKCDELIKEYREAYAQQGKYAPKAEKGAKGDK